MDRLGVLIVGTVPVLLLLAGVGEGELVQFIVLLFTALMAAAFALFVLVSLVTPPPPEEALTPYFGE